MTRARLQPMRWAVGTIMAAAITISLLAPDLVTGSEHDRLPLPGLLVWLWAGIAVAHLAVVAGRVQDKKAVGGVALVSSLVWAGAAVAAIVGPSLVTGTDPTHVPLTAIAAPVLAAFGTSYSCVRAATERVPAE